MISKLIETIDVNSTEKTVDSNRPTGKESPTYVPSKLNAFIRTYDGISLLVNLQSTPIALINTLGPALLTGGPRVVFWGPLIGWLVSTSVSASMAEMASAEPFVGGQYIWCYTNAPAWLGQRGRLLLSHTQAYITWIGWIIGSAVLPVVMSGQIMGLVEIYHQNVAEWTLRQVGAAEVGIGIVIIVLCFWLTLNKLLRVVLRPLEVCGMILVFVIVILLVVILPVTGERNSAHMAFLSGTTDAANTAWGNEGFAFCQGITLVYFMYTASDGIVHMAAEVTDAGLTVPRIIFLSTQVGALLSIPLCVLTPLYMGPLTDDILSAPYPIFQILLDRTNSKALVSVVAILIIVQIFPCACGALATSSRLTLQLAQQDALPHWWTRIWSLTGAIGPLVFVCCFSILMLLTNIGSSIAIVVMFNLATGFLVLSYGVLILVRIAGRVSRGSDLAVGKWHLGKWGLYVNCVAAPCCIFIVTCQVLPLFEPVGASTFPYLGPSIAFVILLGGIDHCVRRHAFNPIRNIRVAKDIVEDEPATQHSQYAVV